jgi:hypothetical protein
MSMRTYLLVAAMFLSALSFQHRAEAQVPPRSDDPLRHGHALLIGNYRYEDRRWPPLDDVPLQLKGLKKGLDDHFDKVDVVENLRTEELRQRINQFIREEGNEVNSRLFIYYAGHGYTDLIRNGYSGFITGTDTPFIDGSARGYNAARPRAMAMEEIKTPLRIAPAQHILFLFDSCFAGTIFAARAGNTPSRVVGLNDVAKLMEKPARDFITAGGANERIPAQSPITRLFLAALNGNADRYQQGVISAADIAKYLQTEVLNSSESNFTPRHGSLQDSDFAEGEFLFRVTPLARDNREIVRRDRAPADRSNAATQYDLGLLYEQGRGGRPKDDREAARLYKLAADQGNASAQTRLGFFYEHGRGGLPEDDREAARLYTLAADQGNAVAQTSLGVIY